MTGSDFKVGDVVCCDGIMTHIAELRDGCVYWSPYMSPEKPPAGAHEVLSEMYGRLMIQSVLPHWSDGARHAFRLAAEMVECRLLGEQFDEDGRGLPIALHTDGLPDEVRPGPWGPPELQLRENYDAIVARRRRGRA